MRRQDDSSRPLLPFDYARCMSEKCPLEEVCQRKTPGHPTYQTLFAPPPSKDCEYLITYKEWTK